MKRTVQQSAYSREYRWFIVLGVTLCFLLCDVVACPAQLPATIPLE